MAETYVMTAEKSAGDVPCLIVAREGLAVDAPLVLMLHGLNSRKEKMLPALYEFARLGCRAVAPDAFLHGDRPDAGDRESRLQTEYLAATTEMIEETTRDISRLLDYFQPVRAAIHGISLGGYITFGALVAEPRLNVASVAMGSPDWLGPLKRWGLGAGHPAFDRAAVLNPLDHAPQAIPPRPLLMLHGDMDDVVPADGVIALEKSLRTLYAAQPERLKLRLFPGLGHQYTDEMLSDTVAWFRRYLF